MLTKRDLDQIRKRFDNVFNKNLTTLLTKDEFYIAMNKLIREVRLLRQEFIRHY